MRAGPAGSAARPIRSGPFRSLRSRDYRIWAAGALVSNVGTWMQRTAQDWLVLTELTERSALALGTVTALQFGPQLLLLPWTGAATDRFDRHRLVRLTQALLGALALCLSFLVLGGHVRLWHLYAFALATGIVSAFDAPARQTFVSDLVDDQSIPSAIALNSISFNAARSLGPAAGGLCIAAFGTGWAFLLNGISFLGVLASLSLVRARPGAESPSPRGASGALVEALLHIRHRPDLATVISMLGLVGTFALAFPIFISTMSVTVFGAGAGRYGLLTSLMALGTIAGTLLAAFQERPGMRGLVVASSLLAGALAVAAAMPTFWSFGVALFLLGIAALAFVNMSNSLMQLAVEPYLRGRVVAIRLAVLSGGSFLGGPIAGLVADGLGPRSAMAVGAAAATAASLLGWRHLVLRGADARPGGADSGPDPTADDDIRPA